MAFHPFACGTSGLDHVVYKSASGLIYVIGGVAREGTLATRLRPRPIRVISSVQVSALGGRLAAYRR